MVVVTFIKTDKYQYLHSFISLLFGAFGVLAFSPYDFWPSSIISLTSLFIMIFKVHWRQAAQYAFFWGIGFFSGGLYWIYISINQFSNMSNYINIFLIILLIIYLTLFPTLFAILLAIIQKFTNMWIFVSSAPVLWSFTEYLRGNIFTGFPWLQFGYSQIDGPFKGIAPILGVEGITFVLVLISVLLALSIKKKQLLPFIISISILLIVWPLKFIQWYHIQQQYAVNIALVQGNINQNIKWDFNYKNVILEIYLQHTLPIIKDTKIIIWPESAIPGNESSHNDFLSALDRQLRSNQTSLITGIIDMRLTNSGSNYYNGLIVIGASIPYKYPNHNRYDKHHLVLFSEKFPGQIFFLPLLNFFNISIPFMQQGRYLQPQLTLLQNIKITAAICYEIILGKQIRDNFRFDTNFLVTIANNAWFGDSIGPWQYFQMARMRALELGRPLLCSTNNGITAIINANGSIQAQLPQFISAVLHANVAPTTGLTPYAKFGTWLFWSVIIFFSYITIIIVSKNKYKLRKN